MEVTLKNFQRKIPIPKAKILKAARAAVVSLRAKRSNLFKKIAASPSAPRNDTAGLSIVFVGTKRMRAVNKKYLKHDYVTDVLAFDLGGRLSEIIICPQIARAHAREHRTSTEREIILYVIHGILHLAGFDDHSEKDRIQMRRMENKLL